MQVIPEHSHPTYSVAHHRSPTNDAILTWCCTRRASDYADPKCLYGQYSGAGVLRIKALRCPHARTPDTPADTAGRLHAVLESVSAMRPYRGSNSSLLIVEHPGCRTATR